MGEPDPLEQLGGPLPGGRAGGAGEVAGELDVLEGVERAEEVEVLEDEAEVSGAQRGQAPFGCGGEVDAGDGDGAAGGAEHARRA